MENVQVRHPGECRDPWIRSNGDTQAISRVRPWVPTFVGMTEEGGKMGRKGE
jgi:hypothetical protein